jgi:hypothetical protein
VEEGNLLSVGVGEGRRAQQRNGSQRHPPTAALLVVLVELTCEVWGNTRAHLMGGAGGRDDGWFLWRWNLVDNELSQRVIVPRSTRGAAAAAAAAVRSGAEARGAR